MDQDVFLPISKGKHINFLDLADHTKVCVHVGTWRWWIHEWFRSRLEGRSSSREINFLIRKLEFWCFACDIAPDLVWVPTWTHPAGALSRNKQIEDWYAPLPKLPLPPVAVFASVHALAEPNLLREPLSAAAHTACEHVRTLESSRVFHCSRAGPARGEHEHYVGRGHSTPSNERRIKKMGLRTAPTRLAGPAARRLGSPCPWDHDHFYWRDEMLYRAGDVERHGPKRALPLRGRDVLVQDVLPTTVQRYDMAVAEFENICESETSMGSKSSSITVSTKWVISASNIFQNTSISRDRVECGSIRLAPECPRTFSLLMLLSFHCLLRPAEARQLRWCDVIKCHGSLSTRCEKVYGIVHIREPTTRRMTGHAAQQHVLLECPGICQLVNTMKSSILDHKVDTEIHCRSTLRPVAATAPQPGRVTSISHAPRTQRRWSYQSLASLWHHYRDLPLLRPGGRWTSARTLETYLQEGTFLLHQKQLSKEVADRLAELAPRFFAEQDYEGSHHQPLQPPRPHRLASRSVTFISQ